MMEKPETQSSSYDDFISRMNRADTLQDRQLKAVNDSLAPRAKELEFLPPEKWPRRSPGRPRGSLRAPPGYHFKSIFGSILHVKKHRKDTKKVKETPQKALD